MVEMIGQTSETGINRDRSGTFVGGENEVVIVVVGVAMVVVVVVIEVV